MFESMLGEGAFSKLATIVVAGFVCLVLFGPPLLLYLGEGLRQRIMRVRPTLPGMSIPVSDDWTRELLELGLEETGSYRTEQGESWIYLRAFATPDRRHSVLAVRMFTGQIDHGSYEFCSLFSPEAEICTSSADMPGTFRYRAGKVVVRVPWKKSVAETWRLHAALCELAGSMGFVPLERDPARFEQEMVEGQRQDYADQVRAGILREIEPDVWGLTLWGAFRSYLLVATHMAFGSLWKRSPSDASLLQQAKRRLQFATRGDRRIL